ncbi:branched-chain amino acid transport system substrate-binding protein [Herbaspirillum sp. Sphag1AN]|uniref:branched-chain amino acid ABC transporter substrate-binding protein n=1 Tax=unclassified Herbaspirillum TaxID=2624150 RepID=UPI0016203DF4|nr:MULTISPECIES: branched-chain amino acid ABC transporter substrate-binding protein [unclassified Herbaspirillum]MBB3213716.1 branched-chain amino acid transport system substrate-binding protein [Herbaspirillum sp. Sphag1AN]MBB3246913.1 branched-chain amino acid transport system substrate-binding protein [Herbaspirillum sp. Sphag64]
MNLDSATLKFRALICRLAPAVALALIALPSWCSNNAADEVPAVVLIGFAGPLSGASASIGQSMEHAVEMALTEANAHPLRIDGKSIQLRILSQDDEGKPRTAAIVAGYLAKAGAVAVVGHWQSTASLSAAPIYRAAGIPQISPGSSNYQLTANGDKNIFRVVGRDKDIAYRCAQIAQHTLQAKRIVIINDDTIYGSTLASFFSESLEPQQGMLVSHYSVNNTTSDFNVVLNALKTNHPDLVFFGGQMHQAAVLQTNLKRVGITANLIAPGIVDPDYLNLTGAAGEGSLGVSTGIPQERMRGWKKFKDRYSAIFGDHIDYYAPFAYDAANAIIAAIKQANSVAPEKLIAALHSLRYQGLTGPISFDAQGNLNHPTYTLFRVQSGKWQPVESFGGK